MIQSSILHYCFNEEVSLLHRLHLAAWKEHSGFISGFVMAFKEFFHLEWKRGKNTQRDYAAV